jgi:vacuolar-type H+-ATPase catalytic subunit A/Vma1
VLQQSSLSANDVYCAPGKQAALLALAIDVYEQCLALVERGVPAERLEAADLSDVVRARDLTPPDGAAEVEAIRERVLAGLEELS